MMENSRKLLKLRMYSTIFGVLTELGHWAYIGKSGISKLRELSQTIPKPRLVAGATQ